MGLECELKYLDVNLKSLSQWLKNNGADSTGPYFESNIVFDRAGRTLKDAGILLRLREKQDKVVLTVKRPPETDIPSSLKVYEEIETQIDDFQAMKTSLETVGFSVVFAYEKVREKCQFMQCTICLDHLPFGDYVEIEGTEETVAACAHALGIGENETSKATYHALNIEYRSCHGLEPNESFVFSDEEREHLLGEMKKD